MVKTGMIKTGKLSYLKSSEYLDYHFSGGVRGVVNMNADQPL